MEINFNERKTYNMQQTIVKILKEKKYSFKSLSGYDNSMFYCMIRCEVYDEIFDILNKALWWAGVKRKLKTFDCPLSICFCDEYYHGDGEPIVFTREDIRKILIDAPENYIGESSL